MLHGGAKNHNEACQFSGDMGTFSAMTWGNSYRWIFWVVALLVIWGSGDFAGAMAQEAEEAAAIPDSTLSVGLLVALAVALFIWLVISVVGPFWMASKFICTVATFGNAIKMALTLFVLNLIFILLWYFSGMSEATDQHLVGMGDVDVIQWLMIAGFWITWLCILVRMPMDIYVLSIPQSIGYWVISTASSFVISIVSGIAVVALVLTFAFGENAMDYANEGGGKALQDKFMNIVQQAETNPELLNLEDTVNEMKSSFEETFSEEGEDSPSDSSTNQSPASSTSHPEKDASQPRADEQERTTPTDRNSTLSSPWMPKAGDDARLTSAVSVQVKFGKMQIPAGEVVILIRNLGDGRWMVEHRGSEVVVPQSSLGPY